MDAAGGGGQHAAVAGAAPFACKLCGRNFSNATSLEIHEQYSHASSTGSAPAAGSPAAAAAGAMPEATPQERGAQPFHSAVGSHENNGDWETIGHHQSSDVLKASAGVGGGAPVSSGSAMARGEDQFYHNVNSNFWPAPADAPGSGHDTVPPPSDVGGGGWSGDHHFPPTPDSGGFGGHTSSKSPEEGGETGAEILDLDSNRVHFYTAPVPPPWAMQQQLYYAAGPPGLPGHPGQPAAPQYPPTPSHFNSTPPPPMIPPKTYMDPSFHQHPQHQQQALHHHNQQQQGYPGLQVAMPPPAMYPGFGGATGPISAEPDSPGGDKNLRADALTPNSNQHCKRPKTYLCEVCDKKFTSMGHLKRHFNTIVHRQTKDGKRGPGISPSGGKAKQRSRLGSYEEQPPAAVPPLVSMPSNMYGMQFPPTSGPPPPQYPMTPPLQEQSSTQQQPQPAPAAAFDFASSAARQQVPLPSATAILAPPPQPLGYNHQVAPEYQVSVAAAPNPQQQQLPPPQQQHQQLHRQHQEQQQLLQQQQASPFPPGFSAAGMQFSHSYGGFPAAEGQPVYCQAGPTAPIQPHQQQQQVSTSQQQREEHDFTQEDVRQPPQEAPSPGSIGSGGSSEDSLEPTEEPYTCCNRRFSSITYWKQHRESQHSGDRPIKCAQCGRRHRTEVSCQEYERTHRRTHQCDTCDKEFMHSSDLKRHKYTHLAQKPYVCQQCGKGFIRKDQMEKHMPTHDVQSSSSPSQQPPQPVPSPQQQHRWSPSLHQAFSSVSNGNISSSVNGSMNASHLVQPSF